MDKLLSLFISIAIFFVGLFGNCAPLKADYKYIKDIPYGTADEQRVDICIPKKASGEVGVMVFVHSGAWSGGYRSEFGEQMLSYASELGVAAVSVGYRFVTDGADVDDMLCDITSAVNAAKKAACINGIKFGNMALTGLSAGAHLALLYAYKNAAEAPLPIKYVISQAGATDFTDKAYYKTGADGLPTCALPIERLCGTSLAAPNSAEKLEYASPVAYVNENSVTTVIAHATDDSVIPFSNALTLAGALADNGVEHYMFTYSGTDHFISDALDADGEYQKTVVELAEKYLK